MLPELPQFSCTLQEGRVFLAGDAAHRFPPAGAFGMNTGIQVGQALLMGHLQFLCKLNGDRAGRSLHSGSESSWHNDKELLLQQSLACYQPR